jgi:dienelactone hydrolase
MTSRGAWLVLGLALLSGSAEAQSFKREELRVPAPGAGKQGLQVLLVKPDLPGRLPLAVITHGSPLKAEERKTTSPLHFLPQATEFARYGWAVAIVVRRGFGDSGGEYVRSPGTCEQPNFEVSATANAGDIYASIEHLRKRSDIDGSRVVAVGQSTGGLAVVALTANPPPGLLAAINFAGGVFASRKGIPCVRSEDRLVEAFRAYGKRSRTPMLWVYSENDSLFRPTLVQRFKEVFSAGGGKAELINAPAFGSDGHILFSSVGTPVWLPYVNRFLEAQNLLPLISSEIVPPRQLTPAGRKSFDDFLRRPLHRAFAVSPNGSYGWRAGHSTVEEASKLALEGCAKHASDCAIAVVDDKAAP